MFTSHISKIQIFFKTLVLVFSFQAFSQTFPQEDLILLEADKLRYEGNFEEAIKLYQKAPPEQEPVAHYILGMMYKNGEGVKVDYEKSYEYFQKSADEDYAPAQFELGVLYEQNLGVPQPRVRKIKRKTDMDIDFNSGIGYADPFFYNYRYDSPFYPDFIYYRRHYITPNRFFWRDYYYNYPITFNNMSLSTTSRPEIRTQQNPRVEILLNRKAFDHYFDSALQGNVDALFSLGEIYNENRLKLFKKEVLETRKKDALAFWKIAARKGHPIAQYRLGQAYFDGNVVPPDNIQSYKWFSILNLQEISEDKGFLLSFQEQAEENLKLIRDRISSRELLEAQKQINSYLASQ